MRLLIKIIREYKKVFYPLILVFIIITTLAFMPHYACGCGDEGNNQVRKGSKLSYILLEVVENVAYVIRKITVSKT